MCIRDRWYYRTVGNSRRPIVDTWWQTETGGILISPLPGATKLKPGSATRPFFGVLPQIVDPDGTVQERNAATGHLVIADSWPGQMRTVYGDHKRFMETYFVQYKGKYFTGDGARRDKDGYYWITGRVDDVINVSGHRMSTAEVESALVAHPKVSEAAVVGFPHDIKGQGIYAFVTLMQGTTATDDLRKALVAWVRKEIGPICLLYTSRQRGVSLRPRRRRGEAPGRGRATGTTDVSAALAKATAAVSYTHLR